MKAAGFFIPACVHRLPGDRRAAPGPANPLWNTQRPRPRFRLHGGRLPPPRLRLESRPLRARSGRLLPPHVLHQSGRRRRLRHVSPEHGGDRASGPPSEPVQWTFREFAFELSRPDAEPPTLERPLCAKVPDGVRCARRGGRKRSVQRRGDGGPHAEGVPHSRSGLVITAACSKAVVRIIGPTIN